MHRNLRKYIFRSIWTRHEKWTLIWVTHYSKLKHKTLKESSKEWLNLFQHHCPMKSGITRAKLTTQKGNILCSKIFSKEQIEKMERTAEHMIDSNTCPTETLIPAPTVDNLDTVNCI